MKTKILLLLSVFVLTTSTTFAATLTVSNHPLGGSQYSTLQAAYNAAANGDTLLVEGTLTNYSLTSYSKSLVFIGQGLNTQKENFLPTKFSKASSGSGSGGSWSFSSGGTGSKFYGITFVGGSSTYNKLQISASDILFENCRFDRHVRVMESNVVFKNCIFTEPGALSFYNSILNVLFSNCIFNSELTGNLGFTQIVNVDHCLFLSTGTCFVDCSGFDIRNCIFMNTTAVTGITSSNFQNNLCGNSISGSYPNFTFFPDGNNDAGGNQTGADPLFVTYTFDAPYSTEHDYHTQSGSPAIGTASDGTDIGVYGGYTNFSASGEVLIAPVMRSMNVSNTTVPANGTINVTVEASKPSDN